MTSDTVQILSRVKYYKVDKRKVSLICHVVSALLGVSQYQVCVRFVSARTMKKLNLDYRQMDKSTDVLAFPQISWSKPVKDLTKSVTSVDPVKVVNPLLLGDVVISLEDAQRNAIESKSTLDREVCFLMVHGILHLVGHDHMKPRQKKEMFSLQKRIMLRVKPYWPGSVRRVSNG